jgi:TIR domain-containing protein
MVWLWILVALAAIGALAVLLNKLRRGRLVERVPRWDSGEASAVAEREQRFDAMILAAKKKEDDEVCCTVFAPHEAARGDGFLVQAFAHLEKQAPLLLEIAKRADKAAEERASKKLGTIERGQELGFYLQMPGLDIDEPQQSVVWVGDITSAEFAVTIPEDFKPRSINCKLLVSHRNVPIGHIRFNFKISAALQPDKADTDPEPHEDFVRYKLAFISYASPDRSEVLKRVQMLDMAKIRYFQDLLTLEAGKQWEPLIYRYIDECDVFYLFWSTAAKKSRWVKKEVQRALKRKGDKLEAPPEIMPVPIEGPPPIKPPPYLASIYFDSKFLYFINPKDDGS